MEKNKLSIFDLKSLAKQIEFKLIESEGEITPEVEDLINIHGKSLSEKLDSYVFTIDQFEANIEGLKKTKERFNQAQKVYESIVDRLKNNIKFYMSDTSADIIRGGIYQFKLSRIKDKIVIEDESKIPNEFRRVVQSLELDKEKIFNELIIGNEVPGCRLEKNFSLRIQAARGTLTKPKEEL